MQIDVIKVENGTATCDVYADSRCIRITMSESDYKALMRDGFFVRDGKEPDSAGVLNTTKEYNLELA